MVVNAELRGLITTVAEDFAREFSGGVDEDDARCPTALPALSFDELEFRRTYMPGTNQWLESVIVRHAGEETLMLRFQGFHADERSKAWGFFY